MNDEEVPNSGCGRTEEAAFSDSIIIVFLGR
jgi:hypothetical protein